MDMTTLGRTGLAVSRVGLGCNGFSRMEAAAPVFAAALDHGITFFDTADMYGGPDGVSERILGELAEGRRQDIVIATKCGFSTDGTYRRMGASRAYIMQAVDESLRRLRTDYIDLYQIHSPDPATPIDETLAALDDLVKLGKIRHAGGSNYSGWQTMDADWTARSREVAGFVTGQTEYSLLSRGAESEIIPAMMHCGLGLLPYFPLASGLLSGKHRRGVAPEPGSRFAATTGIVGKLMTDANLAKVEALDAFARSREHTLIELAFSWLASRAVVSSIIAGASSPEQVAANAVACSWILTPEDLAEIDNLTL